MPEVCLCSTRLSSIDACLLSLRLIDVSEWPLLSNQTQNASGSDCSLLFYGFSLDQLVGGEAFGGGVGDPVPAVDLGECHMRHDDAVLFLDPLDATHETKVAPLSELLITDDLLFNLRRQVSDLSSTADSTIFIETVNVVVVCYEVIEKTVHAKVLPF